MRELSTWQQMWDHIRADVTDRAVYALALLVCTTGFGAAAAPLLAGFGVRYMPSPALWRRPVGRHCMFFFSQTLTSRCTDDG